MRALLACAALLAAAPAGAWRLFGEPSDGRIRPVQALFDANKPAAVVAALTPQFVAGLRGTDLRQAYLLRGESLERLGRSDEALGEYQLGVSLFPENVDLLTRQGAVLQRNGLDEQAKALFLRALKKEPRHWGAHLGLAVIARRSGFVDRAAEHYETALEAVEGRADVWRDYAETLLALREFRTADLALRKALELEPRSADAHVLLALARRAQGDHAEALERLEQARALGAGLGARRARALFLLEAGRLDEARAEADALLREAPGDAAALWTRARVRLARGDRLGAARELAAAEEAGRDDGFAARAAARLGRELAR